MNVVTAPSLAPRRFEGPIDLSFAGRHRAARIDVSRGLGLWRLSILLAWLDIKLRYRGSMLGPFWLTISTAVMICSLGVLYAELFHMDIAKYLPFLALSLVLWNFLSALVTEATTCFTAAEAMIRSTRMPFTVHATQNVVRNTIVFGHNAVVILLTFLYFNSWPGANGLYALPAVLLWLIDAIMLSLVLGAVCARFRDVPPIISSIMQIAFFMSAIIWTPDQLGENAEWLQVNPFFSLIQIVRAPLLDQAPITATWISALAWSGLLCAAGWLLFVRARGRLAFWV